MVGLKSSPGSQNGTGLLQTVIAMKAGPVAGLGGGGDGFEREKPWENMGKTQENCWRIMNIMEITVNFAG